MKFTWIFILSIIICIKISSYNSTAGVYQAIWVESYNYDEAKNFDYVTIKMKFYADSNDFDNQLPPKLGNDVGSFFVLFKRGKDDLVNIKKMYKDNLMTYEVFSFYFPEIDTANHTKPYVMWNFINEGNGFIKYNIKLFNCYDQAKAFLTVIDIGHNSVQKKLLKDSGNTSFDAESVFPSECFGNANQATMTNYLKNTQIPPSAVCSED
jgi:hypothetical protein